MVGLVWIGVLLKGLERDRKGRGGVKIGIGGGRNVLCEWLV